jgi:hypothetical protein
MKTFGVKNNEIFFDFVLSRTKALKPKVCIEKNLFKFQNFSLFFEKSFATPMKYRGRPISPKVFYVNTIWQ